MRNPLFVVYESDLWSPLASSFTLDSSLFWAKSPDQILGALDRAQQESRPLVFLVAETEVLRLRKLVEARAASKLCPPYAWVVLSEEPSLFLKNPTLPKPLLDVISPETFLKQKDFLFPKLAALISEVASPALSRISGTTLHRLNEIFLQLTTEKNIQNLLITILARACELVGAQGGTLLVLTESEGELVFKYRIEDKGENTIVFNEVNLSVQENSLCGYVALTGKTINLESLEGQKGSAFPTFHKGVDHQQIPQSVSLFTLPLKDSRGESRAVLQLCNKLSSGNVIGFDQDDESILRSFATLAAICLEGSEVYSDVQKLFEGFVRASITAIESRDPSTGGHSERVASMCVALARATTETSTGIYRSVKFREEEIKELEYAALLHDFGKIGIREEVLVKSKKLYTHQLDAIQERIRICKAAARIQCLEEMLKKGARNEHIEQEYLKRVEQIDGYWQLILRANEPNILHQETSSLLDQLRSEKLNLPDGGEITLLNDEEYLALAVTQGSLTELERLEIESHVRHTYQFLKMIPWTRDFQHLTEIAYCHHEKLDGSGYPRGLTNHEIPLQSKIMTISDIFDALTAADRWYKEAVPVEKALDILAMEVKEGKLDPVLFEIFKERKIYTASVLSQLGRVA